LEIGNAIVAGVVGGNADMVAPILSADIVASRQPVALPPAVPTRNKSFANLIDTAANAIGILRGGIFRREN
jgi:hypothetical protein